MNPLPERKSEQTGSGNRQMDLGSLTGDGKKALGPRAILVNVLPSSLLTLLVIALVGSGAPADPSLSKLIDTFGSLQDGATLALLGVVVLVTTVILQPLQIAVVQLLEGYWTVSPLRRAGSSIARKAIDIGVEIQRRRFRFLEALQDRSAGRTTEEERAWLEAEIQSYPDDLSKLMPTRLGNVLKAAEDRAGARYGLDADLVFPRLYPLLPQPLLAAWEDLSDQLDSAAHLSITFALATLVSAAFLLPHGWDGYWLAAPAAFLVLAWLSYRSAIAAARRHGTLLMAAFDLRHLDLLGAMHLPLPNDPHEEYSRNQRLTEFLARATAANGVEMAAEPTYAHPGTEPTEVAEPGPVLWEWDAIFGERENGEKVTGSDRPAQPR
jgi:hypothetical protein